MGCSLKGGTIGPRATLWPDTEKTNGHSAQPVFRTIPSKVLTMEQLGMGDIFCQIAEVPRGLVTVAGYRLW